MYPELREERIHGTKEFPFSCYHLHDMPAFFQIPVHWHPEVEIIYVRSGSFNVIIRPTYQQAVLKFQKAVVDLKAIAQDVTLSNDEDGIAYALNKHLGIEI